MAAIVLAAHSTNKLEGEGVKALALVKMFFGSTQDYAQDKTMLKIRLNARQDSTQDKTQRKTFNTFTP